VDDEQFADVQQQGEKRDKVQEIVENRLDLEQQEQGDPPFEQQGTGQIAVYLVSRAERQNHEENCVKDS
jgi:hypothetical protein